jgi:hypothetical protein
MPRGVYRIACTKDCKIRSRPEEFLEPLGGCPRGGIPQCVYVYLARFESIVSASHRYLRLLTPLAMRFLMMEVDEYYAWLIVLYNLVCARWLM